jgi:oxidase EvaA
LGQVKRLLAQPNLVSMDTRTVIACMPLVEFSSGGSLGQNERIRASDFARSALESFASPNSDSTDQEVMSWLTDLKCRHHLGIEHLGLSGLSTWRRTANDIASTDPGSLTIVAVDVESASREVVRWTQPMIAAGSHGLVALLTTEIDGVLHALVRARVEPGSADTITLGPTVQSALGVELGGGDGRHKDLFDLVRGAPAEDVPFSCLQSEEGGRFYHVVSEYRIVDIDGGKSLSLPPDCMWLTFQQMQEMVHYGLLGVEARSLLSCVSYT